VTEPRVGSVLGRYRLEEEIGRGGMGVVFRGRDELLHRSAAVKVLSAALADDEQFRLRFLREMRMASALEHPNVVPVYEAGQVGHHLYLATRFIEGEDLRAAIQRHGALAPARVAAIAAGLAAALDAAHARGLIHRDVKPANVLLAAPTDGGEEHVFLTDFGLARETASESGLTNTGQWMGTVDYVAPEQLEGGGLVSARSDIYSMACLLFEALTGHVPYEGGLARKVAGHTSEPLPSVGTGVPCHAALDAVLARATAKRPADRHPSAGDLGRAVAAAVRGERVVDLERTVATGTALTGIPNGETAAPPRTVVDARRVPSPPPAAPREPAADRGGSPWPRTLAAAVGILLTLALVGLLVRGADGPAPAPSADAAATATERVATVERVRTVTVAGRATTTTTAAPAPAVDAGVDQTFAAGDYVQLASFRTRADASAAADRLATRAGVQARVVDSDDVAQLVPDFYVVLAGPVDAAEGARVIRDARAAGVTDGFVRALSADGSTAAPADLAGRFRGVLRQASTRTPALNKQIATVLSFSAGGRDGTVSYASPTCAGTLRFAGADGPVLRYREHITSGSCTDDGTWHVRRLASGRLGAVWRRADREYFVSGRLDG
jgi:Protein kinase domain/SPOR domain